MAKRITVMVPDDTMTRIEALAEANCYQVATAASVLLRDAVDGKRSHLLPKPTKKAKQSDGGGQQHISRIPPAASPSGPQTSPRDSI